MKTKLIKMIVPVLVIAMLLQVPFAFTAGASDLSENTSIHFDMSYAPANKPGDIQVDMYATTNPNQFITTIGATLVLKLDAFQLVNKSGEIVTDSYKVNKVQLGSSFPLYPVAVDEDEDDVFEEMPSSSMASYNAAANELYLFICGLSLDGLKFAADTKIATFYLQSVSDEILPDATNCRVMALSEYKDTSKCPAEAIAPAEISSKSTVFTMDDVVSNCMVNIKMGKKVEALNIAMQAEKTPALSIKLYKGDAQEQGTTATGGQFALDNVLPGAYTIQITAPGALGFEIRNLNISKTDSDFTLPDFELLFGDANNDGVIAADDIGEIITNFNKDVVECDANCDGVVAADDIGIILLENHFGKEGIIKGNTKQFIDLASMS